MRVNSQIHRTDIEQHRKVLSLKSMYFNRYLLVRYITAVFIFGFLNWSCAMILVGSYFAIVPIVFFLFALVSAFEQAKIFSRPTDHIPITKRCFQTISMGLFLFLSSLLTPLYSQFFPFLTTQPETKIAIATMMACGLCLCKIVLMRLEHIANHTDKQYQYFQAMANSLNLRGD